MKKKEKTYNKLILIGNGFDLALGLKTSYNHFLFWYLKNILIKSINSNKILNERNRNTKYFYYRDQLTTTYWISPYDKDKILEHINSYTTLNELQNFLKKSNKVNIDRNSEIFSTIYDSSLNSWVDIEKSYFETLKLKLKNEKEAEKLNNDFSFLKKQLEIYLTSLEMPSFKDSGKSILFSEQLFDSITHNEIIDSSPEDSIGRKDILLLNFNYTNSLAKLLKSVDNQYKPKINYCINHIHGKLNSLNEKIIFGYGDEMDEYYKKIQDLNKNIYLENIKSFQYFMSPSYRKLLRFVNSNEYQVCIYGHSCGLSDRVMLNEVFENKNCKSIKIYHYKNERDYINKTMEISRHFKSNNSMREKIVNFNPNNLIPQLKIK